MEYELHEKTVSQMYYRFTFIWHVISCEIIHRALFGKIQSARRLRSKQHGSGHVRKGLMNKIIYNNNNNTSNEYDMAYHVM